MDLDLVSARRYAGAIYLEVQPGCQCYPGAVVPNGQSSAAGLAGLPAMLHSGLLAHALRGLPEQVGTTHGWHHDLQCRYSLQLPAATLPLQ